MGEGLEQVTGVESQFAPERVTPLPAPDPTAGVPWTLLKASAGDRARPRLAERMTLPRRPVEDDEEVTRHVNAALVGAVGGGGAVTGPP